MLAKIAGEDDLIKIYQLQGELECLRILAAMPAEIERLDERLEKAKASHSMKENANA